MLAAQARRANLTTAWVPHASRSSFTAGQVRRRESPPAGGNCRSPLIPSEGQTLRFVDAMLSCTVHPLLSRMGAAWVRGAQEDAAALNAVCRSVVATDGASASGEDPALFVGKAVTKTKTVTDAHTFAFGMLSLDFNPLHFNEALARRTRFAGRIAHGMHSASLFTGVLAELTPWCAYLHQDLDFTAPVRPGDVLTATGTIEEIDAKGAIQVRLVCQNQEKVTVIRGRAVVKKLREMFPPASTP